jgi:Mrp family chromosome partitioning ATPase
MTHPVDHPEIESLWRGVAGVASLAVAAAQPGEGTSTVAESLWHRAAAAGRSALLIRCGDGVPSMAPQRVGNTLRGQWTPDAERLAEWREPSRLRAALEALRSEWDLVLVDAPALLDRAARSLPGLTVAAAVEAVLLVVLAGRTPASALREARMALDAAGARLLGLALNDRDNPALLKEMERKLGGLARIAPRLHGRLLRAFQGSALLGLRV